MDINNCIKYIIIYIVGYHSTFYLTGINEQVYNQPEAILKV